MKRIFFTCCVTLWACGLFAQQASPLFSEDFESGQLDPKIWENRVTGVATIEVEQDQAAHGRYALKLHYPDMATQSYAFLFLPHLPAPLKTHLYGRAYVKIAPALPESHTVLLLSGGAGWPASRFEELGASHGTLQPSYQENKSARGQGRGEAVRHGAEPYPRGTWFLLEWEFNDDPSSITIWVNGEKSPVLENSQKTDISTFKWPKDSDKTRDLVGGFEEFGLGVRVWGPTPAGFDIYYDDIALDTKRIGPIK